MCGIVGALGTEVSQSVLQNELRHLAKRGPDHQELIEVTKNILFGSTRLAMVDPQPRSNQPFVDQVSGDIISFNGEIYNYLEIKSNLVNLGEEFLTESDTEVLLKYLQRYGTETLAELNGMFAFAYYNAKNSTVTLARDELGKKPLYYFHSEENFIWSSSIQSVLNISQVKKTSTENEYSYLMLGYYLDPETISSRIKQVLPRQIVKVSMVGSKPKLEFSKFKIENPVNRKNNLRQTLKNAVEARTQGHETIAISLSGGVDSTVVAILAEELNLNCSTYSAHWTDSDKSRYNTDSEIAKGISKRLGFAHHQVEMLKTSELIKELDLFLEAMEEPNSNPSGVSMMRLYSQIQGDGHRLVLTGDGADEIFSGYARYELVSKLPNLLQIKNRRFQELVLSNRNDYTNKMLGLLASQLNPNTPAAWLFWHSIFTPSELERLSGGLVKTRKLYSEFISRFNALTLNNVEINAPALLMSRDFQVWLPMESNRRLDRISMFHSIEARSPFQDRYVVDEARRLMGSSHYKILDKKLLRDAFPELKALGVREDKAGFISPLGHWLRGNPGLIQSTVEYLGKTLEWDSEALSKLVTAPQRGNFRELVQLWNLIVFVRWCGR